MQRLAAAQRRVREAAPDYAIETVAAPMPAVDDVERRLVQGERPQGV